MLDTIEERKTTFQKFIFSLPLRIRQQHEPCIRMIASLLGDTETDFFADRRGSHWRFRRVEPRYEIEVRNQGSWFSTLEDAAKFVNKTPRALTVQLSKGDGVAHFTVEGPVVPEIVTVRRSLPPDEPTL